MDKNDLDQYLAVRDRAGWRDRSERGKVRVIGPDRVAFLHAMISNEVEKLEVGEGRYGTFLKATGKIIADFYYYRFSDFILVDLSAGFSSSFTEELRRYIIMDDVELEDATGTFGHLSVEGPRAADLLCSILGQVQAPSLGNVVQVDWSGVELWWIRKDEVAEPGFEILTPASRKHEFIAALRKAGASVGLEEVGKEVYDILRLERGIPLFGIDFDDRNNPLEARLENAYSLTKGCYVGQEVVSKATHIGGVPKALTCLMIDGEGVPAKGAVVTNSEGREIGYVTSAGFSPRLSRPIVLALLKKGFWEPGQRHQVLTSASESVSAEVVDSFLH